MMNCKGFEGSSHCVIEVFYSVYLEELRKTMKISTGGVLATV